MVRKRVTLEGQSYNVDFPEGVDEQEHLNKFLDDVSKDVDTKTLVPSPGVAARLAFEGQPVLGSLGTRDNATSIYAHEHPTATNWIKGLSGIPAWTALMMGAPEVGVPAAYAKYGKLIGQALMGGGTTAADIEARNATGQEARPSAGEYATRVGLGTALPYVGHKLGQVFSPGSKWAQAELDAADPMRVIREQMAKGPQGTPLPGPSLPGQGGEWVNPTAPTVAVPFRNMMPPTPANVNVPQPANLNVPRAPNQIEKLLGAEPTNIPFRVPPFKNSSMYDPPPTANTNAPYANAVTREDLDAIGRTVPGAERAAPAPVATAETGRPTFTGDGLLDWGKGMTKAGMAGVLVDAAGSLSGMFSPGVATAAALAARALGPPIARAGAGALNFATGTKPVQQFMANKIFSQPGLLNNGITGAPEALYQGSTEEGGPVGYDPVKAFLGR